MGGPALGGALHGLRPLHHARGAPARLAAGATAGIAQFRPSYARAAVYQASLAILAALAGIGAGIRTGDVGLALGGLVVGANVPFTLLVIMPTNRRLMDPAAHLADAEATALLRRWGRLHAVRVLLGAAGLALLVARATR